MRVCLDTNVLISGVFWGGVPGKIVSCWIEGRFELLVSPAILNEYMRVLREISARLGAEEPERWIATIIEKSSIIALAPTPRRWSRDVKDDKFISCATAGRAGYLITGDQDLLELKERVPVQIVTPRAFLDLVQK